VIIRPSVELYQAVGLRLTGREIKLRCKLPISKAAGCSYIANDGVPVIEIEPTKNEQRFLKIFLHECGHIVDQGADWKVIPNLEYLPPGSLDTNHDHAEEDRVDAIALQWLEWSSLHYRSFKPGTAMSAVTRRLQVLLGYPQREG